MVRRAIGLRVDQLSGKKVERSTSRSFPSCGSRVYAYARKAAGKALAAAEDGTGWLAFPAGRKTTKAAFEGKRPTPNCNAALFRASVPQQKAHTRFAHCVGRGEPLKRGCASCWPKGAEPKTEDRIRVLGGVYPPRLRPSLFEPAWSAAPPCSSALLAGGTAAKSLRPLGGMGKSRTPLRGDARVARCGYFQPPASASRRRRGAAARRRAGQRRTFRRQASSFRFGGTLAQGKLDLPATRANCPRRYMGGRAESAAGHASSRRGGAAQCRIAPRRQSRDD